jgi:hypothetical protein
VVSHLLQVEQAQAAHLGSVQRHSGQAAAMHAAMFAAWPGARSAASTIATLSGTATV